VKALTRALTEWPTGTEPVGCVIEFEMPERAAADPSEFHALLKKECETVVAESRYPRCAVSLRRVHQGGAAPSVTLVGPPDAQQTEEWVSLRAHDDLPWLKLRVDHVMAWSSLPPGAWVRLQRGSKAGGGELVMSLNHEQISRTPMLGFRCEGNQLLAMSVRDDLRAVVLGTPDMELPANKAIALPPHGVIRMRPVGGEFGLELAYELTDTVAASSGHFHKHVRFPNEKDWFPAVVGIDPSRYNERSGEHEFVKVFDCANAANAELMHDLFSKQSRAVKQINEAARVDGLLSTWVAPRNSTDNFGRTTNLVAWKASNAAEGPSREDGTIVQPDQVATVVAKRLDPVAFNAGHVDQLSWLEFIAKALDSAHELAFFHGDVTPRNVCFANEARLKLTLVDTECLASWLRSRGLPYQRRGTLQFTHPQMIQALVPKESELSRHQLVATDRFGFIALIVACVWGIEVVEEVYALGAQQAGGRLASRTDPDLHQQHVKERLVALLADDAASLLAEEPEFCTRILRELAEPPETPDEPALDPIVNRRRPVEEITASVWQAGHSVTGAHAASAFTSALDEELVSWCRRVVGGWLIAGLVIGFITMVWMIVNAVSTVLGG
jgi:hypothetical protein